MANTPRFEQQLLRRFGNEVRASSARSLHLLRAIDETLDALDLDIKTFTGALEGGQCLIQLIGHAPPDKPLDPTGKVGTALEAAQKALIEQHGLMQEKHAAARSDRTLTEQDGVAAAYSKLLALITELVETLQQIRDLMAEHDTDAQGPADPGAPLASAADVDRWFASLA